jgi:hypothetical protein
MNIQYQDLNEAIAIIEKQFKKNENRSISAAFRSLRRKSYFSFFGDYPLLATVVNTIHHLGINPPRMIILYAMNLSPELSELPKKEKTVILEQLMKPLSVQTKTANINLQPTKNEKTTDNSSIKNK